MGNSDIFQGCLTVGLIPNNAYLKYLFPNAQNLMLSEYAFWRCLADKRRVLRTDQFYECKR